jgi:hypothetical protein
MEGKQLYVAAGNCGRVCGTSGTVECYEMQHCSRKTSLETHFFLFFTYYGDGSLNENCSTQSHVLIRHG